ncbi:MAG: histidine phosphatase family protein [Bacteroidia bacterium]|nr:histidine phosphatase family protein [Bacteroidia bacterium]MDW8135016.1 histidine phosphatase family protein [Bacteroidia bacterium]
MCQHIFFLRHGEVVQGGYILGQSIDPPLSPEGIQQAKRWAEALHGIPFQVVISSNALRTQQMAEPFLQKGIPHLPLPHFHEMHWGSWEGQPYTSLHQDIQKLRNAWKEGKLDYAPPEGESLLNLLNRAQEGLRLVSGLYPAGNLLIITHGQLLRVLLCALMGYPLSEQDRFHHKRGQLSWAVRLPDGSFYLRALAVDADTPL